MSYGKLTVSTKHHFTENFLIRKQFFLHANMERVNGGFVVLLPLQQYFSRAASHG